MRYINCVVAVLVAGISVALAGGALADPVPSDPNLVLWMRADQGVTGTSLVTKIDDSSDNDNDMIGAGNPEVFMVGNIIQRKFLDSLDYPAAAALGFVLVGVTMALVTVYTRLVGSDRLTT